MAWAGLGRLTDISFYHLQLWPLDRALPKLLEKTRDAGKRAVIKSGSEARVEQLVDLLWSYDQDSWLPHGSAKDGRPEDQPFWLTALDENPNGADFLFMTDGATSEQVGDYERCFVMFDGNDPSQTAAARDLWKTYKEAGYGLKYLQQTDRGGWELKAEG